MRKLYMQPEAPPRETPSRVTMLESAISQALALINQSHSWDEEKIAEACAVLSKTTNPVQEPKSTFADELVALCRKHSAVIFPRRDSEHMYVSVEINRDGRTIWLDFKRVSPDGAEPR